ncbi:MAG: hypothetical protein HKN25_16545 [Pyrinomonadaceae bacterium]|nr:hypothetical protein [Pyrinomonadaceae bacterium]
MIKHIVGFVIFTFIIGTSALVAALFSPVQQKFKSVTVSSGDHYTYKRRKRCRRKKRPKPRPHFKRSYRRELRSAGIIQAIYDVRNNTLTTSHDVKKMSYRRKGATHFHFYVKDGAGTRHVATERVVSNLQAPKIVGVFDGLKGLDTYENLYVISEYKSYRSNWSAAPRFDDTLAVPVLIKNRY